MSTVVELARELINCPSVTPEDAECQAILIKRLEASGFICESHPQGDVSNLWARYGHDAPLFVFVGHTDVVPPGPLTEWISPPFQASIRDECLYGRGATDMKGALAAMVIAVEQFIALNSTFNGSIAFLVTSNEEGQATSDGTLAVLEQLKKHKVAIDYALVGEASSVSEVGDQLRVGRRGSLHGFLKIYGKQGHVAFPELARNPIHLSALALHELAHQTWDEGNEYFPPTHFQITNVHSGMGGALNVIPDHLETAFNFRFSTATTEDVLQRSVEALLKRHDLHFDLRWELTARPFLTRQGKLLAMTQQAIQKMMAFAPTLSTGGGTSDARFIAPTGAEVLELGVPYASAHQINEHVRLNDLEKLAKIYECLLSLLFHARD